MNKYFNPKLKFCNADIVFAINTDGILKPGVERSCEYNEESYLR